MKRLILLTLIAVMVAGSATAAEYGVRAGLTLSPDQFHIGGHADMGKTVGEMRLVPNIEIGFGNNVTLVTFNGDLVYDFGDTPWSLGGELGLNLYDYDNGSSTDLGLSLLGDYRLALASGKTLLLEGKLGLVDSPDFKFTVGFGF